MALKESTWISRDGIELFERQWLTDEEAEAHVILVHGGGEHSGRYEHLAEFLNGHAINVFTFDLRGHGRSQGRRLFIRSFDEYLDDLHDVITRIRQQHTSGHLFLMGHSMGGAISTLYTLTRPALVDRLVLCGPFLYVGKGFSRVHIAIAKLVGKILPTLPVAKLDARHVSSDPLVVEHYMNDPLNFHDGIPAGTGAATLKGLMRIKKEASKLEKPVLILHGTEDKLADVEGSEAFYATIASKDKTLKLYEGFYHEILNEPGKIEVLTDILDWMEERL